MGQLDGKVAFITGAARGQGRAHAATLAGHGADIVAVDTTGSRDSMNYDLATSEDLEGTVKEVESTGRRCLAITADVRDTDAIGAAVRQALDEFGRIDILVANAGIHSMAPLHEMGDDQWNDVIDTNLTGVFKTLRAVAPTHAVPIHQAIIDPIARPIFYGRLTEMTDTDFQVLEPENGTEF